MNYHFLLPWLACTLYALIAGGAPERIAVSVYGLAVVATHFAISGAATRWQGLEFGVFVVDTIAFAAFCLLSMRADRFWPIWASALIGVGVLGHFGRWYAPELTPWAYAVVLTIWSYPILVLFVFGTWAHRRRLARTGSDPAWTGGRG